MAKNSNVGIHIPTISMLIAYKTELASKYYEWLMEEGG
jgi:hypothetical protein